VLKHEEDIEDPYSYMDIEDIKNLEAKKKKVSNKSKAIKGDSSQDKSYGLTSHSRASSKIKKKMGRQETLLNSSGKESLRRTYLIEVENIKRLEEIKVFLYSDEVVQYSEIINESIRHYYQCMKLDNGKN